VATGEAIVALGCTDNQCTWRLIQLIDRLPNDLAIGRLNRSQLHAAHLLLVALLGRDIL